MGEAEREQPDALARILHTEAVILGVSCKAAAARQQSTNLWPRAVLEALDSAVAACRWESALEVIGGSRGGWGGCSPPRESDSCDRSSSQDSRTCTVSKQFGVSRAAARSIA